MSNFDETLMKRLTKLEREVERLRVKERPVGGGGGVTDHGALGGLSDNDHPQYLLTTGKASDSDKLDGVDSTGFVNTTGTQTVDGTKTFSSIPVLPASNPTTANQAVRKGYADGAYLGINGKAADSDKLDGIDSTGFATAGHDHNAAYLGITAKAVDSDKLDGIDSTGFATAGHDHDGVYIPLTNYAGYTGTVVGWSGTPTTKLTYAVIGKLLLMSVYIDGTSNSTTTSVTIPPGLTSASQGVPQILPVRVIDNGVIMQAPGMAILENNGTVIQFYLHYGGSGFTASGAKQVAGNFAWIIA